MTIRAVVQGVGHYLPARVVENAEFVVVKLKFDAHHMIQRHESM